MPGRGDPDAGIDSGADPSSKRRARRRRKRRAPAGFDKGAKSTRAPDAQAADPRSESRKKPSGRRRAKPNRAQRRAGVKEGEGYRKRLAGDAGQTPANNDGKAAGDRQNAGEAASTQKQSGRNRDNRRPRSARPLSEKNRRETRSGDGNGVTEGQKSGPLETSDRRTAQQGAPNKGRGGATHPHRGAAVDGGRRPQSRTGSSQHERAGNPERLYAALDLGTNNCRLLVARPEQRGFRVVDAYSRIVRLGEGIGANGRLSEAAMDRAIDALASCHRKLADRGVMRSRLIATEACRSADNGEHFIDRVKSETGLALEIVNRETEARLAVAGCVTLVDPAADGVLLFDIGGGSSEIVWLDLRNRCGARGYALTRFIRSWISLPVGVVNLAERHGGVHVTPEIFERMVDDVSGYLEAFPNGDALGEAINTGFVHMLGTSGTVTTLAGVQLGLKRYDRRRVDGAWLDNGQVSMMIEHLRDLPYEQRVENPCIGADRADLVLAGCAILEAIRRRWTCERLRVADRGLREGILTELMSADGVWSRKGSRRRGGRQRGTR